MSRGVKDDVMNINGQHVVSKTLLDLIYGQNVYHKPNVKTISKVKPHPVSVSQNLWFTRKKHPSH